MISKVKSLDMESGEEWMHRQAVQNAPVTVTEVSPHNLQLLTADALSLCQLTGRIPAATLGYRRAGGSHCVKASAQSFGRGNRRKFAVACDIASLALNAV